MDGEAELEAVATVGHFKYVQHKILLYNDQLMDQKTWDRIIPIQMFRYFALSN